MSRGAGRIERTILAAFEADPDACFTTDKLCERAFPGIAIEKKHRVAVLRALRSLADRDESRLGTIIAQRRGGTVIAFNKLSVDSYAFARKRADFVNNRKPDAAIVDDLVQGGRDRHLVERGGAWWRHVMSWREEHAAREAGDHGALEKVLAARAAENAKVLQVLGLTPRASKA